MKTIAQQLNVKEFPFEIRDNDGNLIYYEESNGYWSKREYNSNGKVIYHENSYGSWQKWGYDSSENVIYYENSDGVISNDRSKPSCEGKIVEIDGKKYQLKEVK